MKPQASSRWGVTTPATGLPKRSSGEVNRQGQPARFRQQQVVGWHSDASFPTALKNTEASTGWDDVAL